MAHQNVMRTDDGKLVYEPTHKQPWYHDIVEWFMMNPGGKIVDCAKALGKTPHYIEMLLRSDMMKAHMSKARADRMKIINEEIVMKGSRVLMSTLGRMEEKIRDAPIEKLALEDLTETSSTLLAALGFTPQKGAVAVGQNVQVNLTVNGGMLAAARAKMSAVQEKTELPGAYEYPPATSGLDGALPSDNLDDLFSEEIEGEVNPTPEENVDGPTQ